MNEKIEHCCACDEPTGRAGAADDSLYTNSDYGPFCYSCYEGASWADAELTRLRAINKAYEKQIAESAAVYAERDRLKEELQCVNECAVTLQRQVDELCRRAKDGE